MTIKNSTAFVSGAGRGVGRATVDALLAAGAAAVIAADLRAPDIDDPRVRAVALDVTDEASLAALFADAPVAVRVAINCAGMYTFRDGLDIARDDWMRSLAVNLTAPFLVTRAVSKRLIAEGLTGAIINVSSIAGKRGFPNQADYCTAKAGLIGFTRASALDLAPHGITVNSVAPGTVDTPMMASVVADLTEQTGLDVDAQRAAMVKDIPIGRMQTAAEIAAAITFLTSAEARAITGETLVVDGGLTRD